MSTKADLINAAYSRARISGLTRNPTPADTALALRRLENMAALWESRNICTGYNFEDSPAATSLHNVPREHWDAYESNLATKILADFGKEPHPTLMAEAAFTFSALPHRTDPVPYPSRMPRGSGNTLRNFRWRRYYSPDNTAPNECATNRMSEDDVDIFTEHYDSWLADSEDISTYTITSSNSTNLTVSNDSLTSPDITYTVTANEAGTYTVTIKVTTTLNRILSRVINFVVT